MGILDQSSSSDTTDMKWVCVSPTSKEAGMLDHEDFIDHSKIFEFHLVGQQVGSQFENKHSPCIYHVPNSALDNDVKAVSKLQSKDLNINSTSTAQL